MKAMRIAMVELADILSACLPCENKYDVTSLFETIKVVVPAEQNGRLLQLGVAESPEVSKEQQVSLIDTVQLILKAHQVGVNSKPIANQKPDVDTQIAIPRQQLEQVEQERQRFEGLVNDGAANRKQLDDTTSAVRILKRQLAAQQSSLNNSTCALNLQISANNIQKYRVPDRLKKRHVTSPLTGTVFKKYAEGGEFAFVSRPLFKVADTKNLFLRAYFTSRQLEKVKIGWQATVFSDHGDDTSKEYKGKMVWISSRSEFTPKTILTDDECADQVYAMKIAVQGNGHIKIGMYGGMKL